MRNFQIVQNVNIAPDVLANVKSRPRRVRVSANPQTRSRL